MPTKTKSKAAESGGDVVIGREAAFVELPGDPPRPVHVSRETVFRADSDVVKFAPDLFEPVGTRVNGDPTTPPGFGEVGPHASDMPDPEPEPETPEPETPEPEGAGSDEDEGDEG